MNDVCNFFIRLFRRWELQTVVKSKKFSMLDIGCGDGNFLKYLLEHGLDIVGIDKKRSNHPKIYCSTIEKFTTNKKFDVVSMYHVLEHIQYPEKILLKVRTLLKKTGVLIIEVPLIDNLTEKFLNKQYFIYYDKTHRYFFSKGDFLKVVDDAGFNVIKNGFTFYEFPFTLITSSFKKGLLFGFLAIILYIPFKLLSLLELNNEIIRIYCQKKSSIS